MNNKNDCFVHTEKVRSGENSSAGSSVLTCVMVSVGVCFDRNRQLHFVETMINSYYYSNDLVPNLVKDCYDLLGNKTLRAGTHVQGQRALLGLQCQKTLCFQTVHNYACYTVMHVKPCSKNSPL